MRNLESLPLVAEFISPIPQGSLELGLNHPKNSFPISKPTELIADRKAPLYGPGLDASFPISHRGDPKDPWKNVFERKELRATIKQATEMHLGEPIFLNPQS